MFSFHRAKSEASAAVPCPQSIRPTYQPPFLGSVTLVTNNRTGVATQSPPAAAKNGMIRLPLEYGELPERYGDWLPADYGEPTAGLEGRPELHEFFEHGSHDRHDAVILDEGVGKEVKSASLLSHIQSEPREVGVEQGTPLLSSNESCASHQEGAERRQQPNGEVVNAALKK